MLIHSVPKVYSYKNFRRSLHLEAIFEGVGGQVLCEQIRVVDKVRLKEKIGSLLEHEINEIRFVLKQIFFD